MDAIEKVAPKRIFMIEFGRCGENPVRAVYWVGELT
jgi:hypothetical protein